MKIRKKNKEGYRRPKPKELMKEGSYLRIRTPDGMYDITWHEAEGLSIRLEEPSDHLKHGPCIVVKPRSGNLVAIRPQRKD